MLPISTLHEAIVHYGRRRNSCYEVLLCIIIKKKTKEESQGNKILGAPHPKGKI